MLPTLPPKPSPELIAKARGEADALALRLSLHDGDLHAQNQPISGPARAVFEALEQARVEALLEAANAGADAATEAERTRGQHGWWQRRPDGAGRVDQLQIPRLWLWPIEVISVSHETTGSVQ